MSHLNNVGTLLVEEPSVIVTRYTLAPFSPTASGGNLITQGYFFVPSGQLCSVPLFTFQSPGNVEIHTNLLGEFPIYLQGGGNVNAARPSLEASDTITQGYSSDAAIFDTDSSTFRMTKGKWHQIILPSGIIDYIGSSSSINAKWAAPASGTYWVATAPWINRISIVPASGIIHDRQNAGQFLPYSYPINEQFHTGINALDFTIPEVAVTYGFVAPVSGIYYVVPDWDRVDRIDFSPAYNNTRENGYISDLHGSGVFSIIAPEGNTIPLSVPGFDYLEGNFANRLGTIRVSGDIGALFVNLIDWASDVAGTLAVQNVVDNNVYSQYNLVSGVGSYPFAIANDIGPDYDIVWYQEGIYLTTLSGIANYELKNIYGPPPPPPPPFGHQWFTDLPEDAYTISGITENITNIWGDWPSFTDKTGIDPNPIGNIGAHWGWLKLWLDAPQEIRLSLANSPFNDPELYIFRSDTAPVDGENWVATPIDIGGPHDNTWDFELSNDNADHLGWADQDTDTDFRATIPAFGTIDNIYVTLSGGMHWIYAGPYLGADVDPDPPQILLDIEIP